MVITTVHSPIHRRLYSYLHDHESMSILQIQGHRETPASQRFQQIRTLSRADRSPHVRTHKEHHLRTRRQSRKGNNRRMILFILNYSRLYELNILLIIVIRLGY